MNHPVSLEKQGIMVETIRGGRDQKTDMSDRRTGYAGASQETGILRERVIKPIDEKLIRPPFRGSHVIFLVGGS